MGREAGMPAHSGVLLTQPPLNPVTGVQKSRFEQWTEFL